ncbi:hypothetical protein [Deinococcus alpinitundrae]|nr:hypothetical protein [Deinococcus alpinitundrae]
MSHSRVSLTLDIYGHMFEEQRERAALTLNDLMKRSDHDDLLLQKRG